MVDKIVMLAEARGWDQGELESRAGLARGRISKWKADQGEPSAKQALRMARLLNVSMEFLADDDLDEPVPVPSIALADDERAIIDLYHDLELDKREAVKRLATPLTAAVPWLPGSVRDQTPLLNGPKPARRNPETHPHPNEAVQGRVHRTEDDPAEKKPRRKGGLS